MSWRSNGSYWGPRPSGPSSTEASGWWDFRSHIPYARSGGWPISGAPLLYMPFNFAIEDESTFNNSISSIVGTVTWDAASLSASVAAGSAVQIDTPHSVSLPGDFTVEAWLKMPALGTFRILGAAALGAEALFQCAVVSAGTLLFSCTGSGSNNTMTASGYPLFTANAWHHLAFVRKNSVVKAYLNGEWLGVTVSGITAELLTTQALSFPRIGSFSNVAGYLDDLRVTGLALYDQNFTPTARSSQRPER